MDRTLRKIVVGDSYSFNIKYVKDSKYKVGGKECTLTQILPKEDDSIDLYLNDGMSTFLWKTINVKPLEKEYDVNFK